MAVAALRSDRMRSQNLAALLRHLRLDLPRGEPHKIRRPDGPPSTWPPIAPAASPREERAA
jgi:hypothetical protein